MSLTSISSIWKSGTHGTSSEHILKAAYRAATAFFASELTQDECKRIWIAKKDDMDDILSTLQEAKLRYEKKSQKSRAWTWLNRLSKGMMHYGAIIDTLSQHHPEYVSLAWGAIKFVFVGILNHGELISTLANALIEITAVLADAEVKLTLYATPAIQDATAQLLAHIIRFSHRAIKWYSESKLKHMFHAIIHPAPLYYADLLESISTCAWRIYKLANNAAQAEQRDMHNMLIQLKQSLVEHQSINSSKFMDITQYLQQIQHSQILEIVANSVLPSPEKSLQYYRAMSTRRRSRGMVDQGTQGVCTLQDWGGTRSSKLIVVKGSFRTSHIARDLSVRIISLIQKSGIPAIWVLNLKQKDKALHPTAPDILKLLAYQILQTNSNLRNARLDAIKFQTARVESEWLNILVDLLQGVPEIYMILDVETLDRDLYETPDWISLFLQLFQLLQERSIPVHVKVALVSYHTKILDGSDLPTACVVDLSKTKGQGSSMGQSRNLHIRNRNRALKRDVVPSYASRAYFAA